MKSIKPETLPDFEEALCIDKYGLEEAIQRHPDFVYRIGVEVAYAISERDAAKVELEEVVATTDARERRAAAKANEKVTETQLASRVKQSKGVKEAQQAYLDLKHTAAQWQEMKSAFEARGHALRELVTLYVNDYYASAESSNVGKMRDRHAGEVRTKRRQNAGH